MKVDITKHVVSPLLLSTLMISSSLLISYKVSQKTPLITSKDKDDNKEDLLDWIFSSFETKKAFAESDGYFGDYNISFEPFPDEIAIRDRHDQTVDPLDIETLSICMIEGETKQITSYLATYENNGIRIHSAEASQDISTLATPLIQITPTSQSYPLTEAGTYNFTVTGPAVSAIQDHYIFPINVKGNYRSTFYDDPYEKTIKANVRVEHKNLAPTFSDLSTNFSTTVNNSTDLTNVNVSFKINDIESNKTNITLELSSDNFATVLSSYTTNINNQTAGTTISHTFNNLPVGSYNWRARAEETDAQSNCLSYPNQIDPGINLSTIAPPKNININYLPAATATSTPLPTATPTPVQRTISGHLFYDKNKNKVQDSIEPDLSNVNIIVVDSTNVPKTVSTNSDGNYSVQAVPGVVKLSVDKNDPDLPVGYEVTVGNETQSVVLGATSDLTVPDIGYYNPTLAQTGKDNKLSIIIASLMISITLYLKRRFISLNK